EGPDKSIPGLVAVRFPGGHCRLGYDRDSHFPVSVRRDLCGALNVKNRQVISQLEKCRRWSIWVVYTNVLGGIIGTGRIMAGKAVRSRRRERHTRRCKAGDFPQSPWRASLNWVS